LLNQKASFFHLIHYIFFVELIMPPPLSKKNQPGQTAFSDPHDILNNSPAGVFISTPEGRYISANPALARMYGYGSPEELMQSVTDITIQVYVNPEDRKGFIRIMKEQREVVNHESRRFRRDGTIFWVSINARAEKDEDGRIVAYQGFTTDITGRKQAQEQYQDLVENINDVIFSLDLDGRITYLSPSAKNITGDKASELLGRNFKELIDPRDIPLIEQAWNNVLQGRLQPSEYKLFLKPDETLWVRTSSRPVIKDGTVTGIVGVLTDISEYKRAEHEKEKAEQRFRLMFMNAPMPYQSLDEQGNFLDVNQTFLDVLGYTREELIGKNFSEILHPDWRDHFRENFPRFKAVGEILGVEFEMVKKDGSTILVFFNGKIQRDHQDRFIRTHCIFQDITERKQAEEALIKSEQRLSEMNKCLLSMGPDFDENIEKLTALCGKLLGADCALYNRLEGNLLCSIGQWHTPPDYEPRDNPEGHICYDVINEGSNSPVVISNLHESPYAQTDPNVTRYGLKSYIGQAVRRGEGYVGSICAVFQSDVVFSEIDNRVLGLIASALGAEENRRQAEEALRESEKRLRIVFESMPGGVFIHDLDGKFLMVNYAACRNTGYSKQELLQMCVKDVDPHLLDFDNRFEPWDVLKENKPFFFESFHTRKDGSCYPVEIHLNAITLDGEPVIFAAAYDITERKRIEEALRESEEKHRALVDGLPDTVMRFDRDGRHLFVSDNIREETGIEPQWFIGKTHTELGFPEELTRFWEESIRWVFANGKPLKNEFTAELKTGTTVFDWRLVPEKDAQGAVSSVLTISRDITERRQAEEEREKLQAQLLQAQKMESIGMLAGGIAHDFNNLLHAMGGNLELLDRKIPEDHPGKKRIPTIRKSMDRAAQLVRQMLMFSRKADVRTQALDLNQEIHGAVKLLERSIPRMISIELILDENAWSINADPIQVEQMLLNMGTNAADAMPDGGILLIETANAVLDHNFTRTHTEAKSGKYVLMTVTDTGTGMDQDTLEKIFDPFFTTKEVGKGTGLGLASAYGIVKAHEGYITCRSQPGRGTTFKIYWPAVNTKLEK
jgi:two-component system, cell cycle sensor histidine kinase and response regulator CckA